MNNKLLDTILHLIEAEHEQLCKRDFPKITSILDELINKQEPYDEALMELSNEFDELKTEVEIHVLEENQFLLPLSRRVLTDAIEEHDELELVKHTVEAFASQHENFENKCNKLIETSECLHVHQDDMLTKAELTDLLCDIKLLLHRHNEKEHNLLFPVLLHHCDELLAKP